MSPTMPLWVCNHVVVFFLLYMIHNEATNILTITLFSDFYENTKMKIIRPKNT
jgi:hypothetical protein